MTINNIKKYKKGAMFGLDARIALAIFGALSVISGASLYSAIQEAKVTSIVLHLKEMEKAYEAYYIDVLSIPNKSAALVDESFTGGNESRWDGPYINWDQHKDGGNFLVFPPIKEVNDNNIGCWLRAGANFGHPLDLWVDGAEDTARKCDSLAISCARRVWLRPCGLSESILDKVDEKIDSGDGRLDGKFRWMDDANAAGMYSIFYFFMSVEVPDA